MQYVTVADVDAAAGEQWTWDKDRCVMEANTWLGVRLGKAGAVLSAALPPADPWPRAVVQAGELLAQEAAENKLYVAQEAAVSSFSVSAGDGVEVRKSFVLPPDDAPRTPRMALIEALLQPWIGKKKRSSVFMLQRI